jgi:protease I
MKVRTLLIPAMVFGAGIAGCRSRQTNLQQEPPGPGRLSATQDTPTKDTQDTEVNPNSPTVIGVNTTRVNWDGRLTGVRVAMLATDGFEEAELIDTRQALADEGAVTVIVSTHSGEIQGYKHDIKGNRVKVDLPIEEADPDQFDAMELPGGVVNGDKMRLDPAVTAFVKKFAHDGKPIAAICHGLWPMIEARVVRHRTVTSWPSLKTDLKNAGAKWVDQEVVVDKNFVTSRQPDDIPAYNEQAITLFANRRQAIGGGPAPE